MTSRNEQLLNDALQLPPEERMALVARLIDSFDGPADPGVDAAWAAELKRRLENAERGQASFIPWDHARNMIVGNGDGSRSDCQVSDAGQWEQQWADVAERRDTEIENGSVSMVSSEDAFNRLTDRVNKR